MYNLIIFKKVYNLNNVIMIVFNYTYIRRFYTLMIISDKQIMKYGGGKGNESDLREYIGRSWVKFSLPSLLIQ